MVTDVETMAPETILGVAAARFLAGFQHDFPVVDGTRVVGVLTHADVMRGLAARRPDLTVGDVMHSKYAIAGAGEGLVTVLGRLPPNGSSIIVLHDDQLVGLLDPDHPDHIGKLLEVHGVVDGHLA